MVDYDPDARLSRVQTAEALTRAGFPIAASTLAAMVVRGGGPPFSLWGRFPLYRWGDTLEWAQQRLSTPRRTTAEADAQRAAGTGRRVGRPRKASGPNSSKSVPTSSEED